MLLSAPFVKLYPQMSNLIGGKAMSMAVLKDLGRSSGHNIVDKNFKEEVGSTYITTAVGSSGTISMPPKHYRPPLPSLY